MVPGSFWERVGECDSETHGRDTVHVIDANLLEGVHVNQYLLDEENFFAARVLSHDSNKIRLKDLGRERLMSRKAWGVHPKNVYQGMALDALLEPHIDLRQDIARHGGCPGAGDRKGDLREGDRHP